MVNEFDKTTIELSKTILGQPHGEKFVISHKDFGYTYINEKQYNAIVKILNGQELQDTKELLANLIGLQRYVVQDENAKVYYDKLYKALGGVGNE